MRGGVAVTQHAAALERSLADASPAVRIVAAQALAAYGPSAALGRRSRPRELAPPEKNGVLVSMSALAAIEALGAKAAPLHAAIAAMKPGGPSPDGRYNSYVPRLIANIVPDAAKPGGIGRTKGNTKKPRRTKTKR